MKRWRLRSELGALLLAGAGLVPAGHALSGPAQGPSQAPLGEASRADYSIRARYEAPEQRLDGSSRIRWTNGTQEKVSDLWFHLYLNAFANNRSTHLVESRGTLRGTEIRDEWGWSRPTGARLLRGGEAHDLLPTLRYRRTDEDSADDLTVFSLDLPEPVGPGESIDVELTWESKLPRVRRRTGAKGDFLFAAQWFPKLGVYEAGRGWNCHSFHANTEFYADYGAYDVVLDLPVEYDGKVGGSGGRGQFQHSLDRVLASFSAPTPADRARVDARGRRPLVHDFAWTGDPEYVVYPNVFSFRDWAGRFPSEVERARAALGPNEPLELRDVAVTVLLQPEHAHQAERHFQATCAALFFYGLWFGEYPYEHITVVDPAWGAGAAGGMEYPTLFTCGSNALASEGEHVPESVTVHECGHQFWYGLVGNNEFESAWLDEGFNSYTDSEVLWRVWGARRSFTRYSSIPVEGALLAPQPGGSKLADWLSARALPLPLLPDPPILPSSGFLDAWRDQPWFALARQTSDPRWNDRVRYLGDPDSDPVDTPGWRYVDRQAYSVNSYPRTAVALRTLAGLVGWDAFARGMRGYAGAWRYGHPKPDDFFRSFQEHDGLEQDLSWYFEAAFRGTDTADWSVSVDRRRASERRGYFPGETGEFALVAPDAKERERELAEASRADDPELEAERDRGPSDRPWVHEIVLRHRGDLRLPIPLRLRFEDGTSEDVTWSREEQAERRWKRIERTGPSKLASAVLDPDGLYYLDTDRSNDRWYDQTDEVAPLRWAERVFQQLAHGLSFTMSIGG